MASPFRPKTINSPISIFSKYTPWEFFRLFFTCVFGIWLFCVAMSPENCLVYFHDRLLGMYSVVFYMLFLQFGRLGLFTKQSVAAEGL